MDGDESPGGEGGRRWAKDQSGGGARQLRTGSRQAVGRAPNRYQRSGARVWRTADGDLADQEVPGKLLIAIAIVETPIGVMLLVSPTPVVALLLGVSLEAPAALVVARIAGAALISLGCACWLARNDGASRARGLVAAMLL